MKNYKFSNQLFVDETTFSRYLYSFFFFHMLHVCIMSLCFFLLIVYKIGPYHELYLYQTKKLNNNSIIDTIFIGDSSLGNAINSDFFNSKSGLKSVNLALTGLYGYSGSYNMLKKAYRNYSIKNVILVHTLDMMTRPISYDGYLYSMDCFSDFTELKFNKKIILIDKSINNLMTFNNIKRLIIHSIFMINMYTIENDYIKQGKAIEKNIKISPLRLKVNPDKILFLKKIVDYCKQHNLNLIYIHGPHLDNIDEQSIADIGVINNAIKSTGIDLIETIPMVSRKEIGNQFDHIHPSHKLKMTMFYYNLIKERLVVKKTHQRNRHSIFCNLN